MLTIKQLNRKLVGIRKSAASIRDNVQLVLCNVAGHAFEHGDVTVFDKLYAAAGGLNKKKIVKWVHANGFARLQKDGTFKVNKTMRKEADFESGAQVVEYLTANVAKWYANEETPEQILKALDVAARIRSLTTQINNAADKGNVIKVDFKATEEAITALQSTMAANA